MRTRKWTSWLRRSSTRARPARASQPLRLEILEQRTLLDGAFDPSSILVRYQPEVADPVPPALEGTSVERAEVELVPGLRVVRLNPGVTVDAALRAYRGSPLVVQADPNYLVETSLTPNDPSFSQLWAMPNISAPAAWDLTTGSSRTVVAVLDTGAWYDHVDLCKNIWVNQGEIPASRRANLVDLDGDGFITFWDLNHNYPNNPNIGPYGITDANGDGRICGSDIVRPMQTDGFIDLGGGGWNNRTDDDGNGHLDDLVGMKFYNNGQAHWDTLDVNGHGTHVSGTIGAVGNNGLGVAGVNWRVQIMPIDVLPGGSGFEFDIVRGLNYAVAMGATISNNSYGCPCVLPNLRLAIAAARNAGHIFVAAAGNANSNNNISPFDPATAPYDNVIAVAATDSANNKAGFSNYGSNTVHLAAPGVNILSTWLNNGYNTISGTSMASPHMAGVVALVRMGHSDWYANQVKDRVLSTVDYIAGLGTFTTMKGRLNAGCAVARTAVPQTVNATGGNDTIVLQRWAAQPSWFQVLVNSTVVLQAPWCAASTLSINALGGNDTIHIEDSVADIPVRVDTGAGADLVEVSPIAKQLGRILGNVHVTGSNARVVVHDRNHPETTTYTVTNLSVARPNAGTVFYGAGVTRLELHGGDQANRYHVRSTRGGVDTQLFTNTTTAYPTVVVGHNGRTNNILGSVQVQNPPNFTDLIVDDSAAPPGSKSVTLHVVPASLNCATGPQEAAIVGMAPAPISICSSDVRAITLTTGQTTDTFHVLNTPTNFGPAGVTTRINAGAGADTVFVRRTSQPFAGPTQLIVDGQDGNDTVNVGDFGNLLNDIRSGLTVLGGAGTDQLFLFDQGNAAPQVYTVTAATVTRTNNVGLITYGTLESLNLRAGLASDDVVVNGVASGTTLVVSGGTGAPNNLWGPSVPTDWNVLGGDQGNFLAAGSGPVFFNQFGLLLGGSATDRFAFPPAGSLSQGLWDLGGVNNKLDYSTRATSVYVNLFLGEATGVAGASSGAVFGIQDVTTGSADDILVGDDLSNVLEGGAGRDLLIAGGWFGLNNPDTLRGGTGDDVLIGGYTFYEWGGFASLSALHSAWLTAGSYAAGDAALLAMLSGAAFYNNATGGNTLDGDAGQDLFFGQNGLDLNDQDVNSESFYWI